VLAVVVYLPVFAGISYWLAPAFLSAENGLAKSLALAALFAGLPACLSGGGIGQRAALAWRIAPAAKRTCMRTAAQSSGMLGLGLIFLVAIPLSAVSDNTWHFALLALAGATVGAATGVLLSLWTRPS